MVVMEWLRSIPKSVFQIPIWIFIAKEIEVWFQIIGWKFESPVNENWFISNFVEWFGVLYGILLPLILVRAWEQLDAIDREFDREADTAKTLYKDLEYLSDLSGKYKKIGGDISKLLRDYVYHVVNNYKYEIKQSNDESKNQGDSILEEMRGKFKILVRLEMNENAISDTLINELFAKLNDLVDNRGDRISHASQRLFENLHKVALITSIIFLIPFYFAGPAYFSLSIGLPYFYLLDTALILSVTFLVIYIYMIIEDLDEPFEGVKKITDDSWQNLLAEMDRGLGNDGERKAITLSPSSPKKPPRRKTLQ